MANSAQARKRARQAEATRKRNASLKSELCCRSRSWLATCRLTCCLTAWRKRVQYACYARRLPMAARRCGVKTVKTPSAAGDTAAATKTMQASQSAIDRITEKKIVHKNAASRTKSRLAQAIKAMP